MQNHHFFLIKIRNIKFQIIFSIFLTLISYSLFSCVNEKSTEGPTGESRYLLIGKLDNKIWSAIFTLRTKKIRIISFRRSRKNEEEIYKSWDFDRKFDNGDDIYDYLDLSRVVRQRQEQKRVNVDFPVWMFDSNRTANKPMQATRLAARRSSWVKHTF
jgi:uncharacterized DUF497 family protein